MNDTWTVESLTHLLLSRGMARRVALRGPLFVLADPLPQAGRPGEPTHPDTPCLAWTAGGSQGYGYVQTPKQGKLRVHVVTFEAVNGPVPDGMDLAHLCERRPCSRPDHVRPKGRQANAREGANRRYPDWLLDMAPVAACPQCGGAMTVSVVLGGQRKPGTRPRWRSMCHPCSRVKQPGVPAQWSRIYARMSDADLAALHAFLN